MKKANIGDFKDKLSTYLNVAERGEEVQICKRNVPIARLLPMEEPVVNRTVLGCGRGTLLAAERLDEPLVPEKFWEMLG